jgi:predicted RNA binding protein YcfA (HicA-like mRNA interferase family)
MKLPRDLSGREVVQGLCRDWGYRVVHQQGSHIILQTEEPGHQRLAVPDHIALRIGTLNSILRAVSQHKSVDRETLLKSLRY